MISVRTLSNPFKRVLYFICGLSALVACSDRQVANNENERLFPKASVGKVQSFSNFPSQFVKTRNIHVWVPQYYRDAVDAGIRFAVVYMHDGQMLFDRSITWNQQEWGVDETAQRLINDEQVIPFIVVGIENGGEQLRYAEYMPQKPYELLPESVKQQLAKQLEDQNTTIQSDNYLKFLVTELKPFIDRNFYTLPERPFTYVAGSSMGGLISWYAVAEYPDVFGGCACLSTHFIGGGDNQDFRIYQEFERYMKAELPVSGTHRLYFDYGDQTLDQYYPPFFARFEKALVEMNADPEQVIVRYFPGAAHTETAWQERLDIPLSYLLGKDRFIINQTVEQVSSQTN